MKRKWKITLGLVIIILVAGRIALPYVIVNKVNKILGDLEGYKGAVKDVDLNLYRGAYVIDSLEIFKRGDTIPIPFASIPKIDLSIHWGALFDGALVGEIIFDKPDLNFANTEGSKQYGEEADWRKTIRDLFPFTINRLEVINGKIFYRDFEKSGKVEIGIDSLFLTATNLTNAEKPNEDLPATIEARGNTSLGGGVLDVSARANVLKQPPDFDINLKFEDVYVPGLNDFVRPYINADFSEGTFNLYSEVLADDGEISGYIKPILQNLKVVNWDDEDTGFFKKIWESVLGLFAEGTENQPKDQFATRVPINGSLDNTDIGIFATIWNVFKNGFVEAFEKDLEDVIQPE